MIWEGHATKPIYAWCPYCRAPVPVLEITVEVTGLLRRRVEVMLDGDATDFIAHMWAHGMEDQKL